MKKINKKMVSLAAIIITVSLALTSVYAQVTPFSTNDRQDCEYTYTGMSAEKARMIIEKEQNEMTEITQTPKSILCIFGHSLQNGIIERTYHKPCKVVTTKYSYCTRTDCNYSKMISESTRNLNCH